MDLHVNKERSHGGFAPTAVSSGPFDDRSTAFSERVQGRVQIVGEPGVADTCVIALPISAFEVTAGAAPLL